MFHWKKCHVDKWYLHSNVHLDALLTCKKAFLSKAEMASCPQVPFMVFLKIQSGSSAYCLSADKPYCTMCLLPDHSPQVSPIGVHGSLYLKYRIGLKEHALENKPSHSLILPFPSPHGREAGASLLPSFNFGLQWGKSSAFKVLSTASFLVDL